MPSEIVFDKPIGVRQPIKYGVSEDHLNDERYFILRFGFKDDTIIYLRCRKDLFAKMLTKLLYEDTPELK